MFLESKSFRVEPQFIDDNPNSQAPERNEIYVHKHEFSGKLCLCDVFWWFSFTSFLFYYYLQMNNFRSLDERSPDQFFNLLMHLILSDVTTYDKHFKS